MHQTLDILADLARRAGAAILETRAKGFGIRNKEDRSPVTDADMASHQVVARGLAEHFPDIPIISEEIPAPAHPERAAWPRFFLVDPLDGTKEFIKDNGEYCVCVALVEGERPALGAVYIPTRDLLYAGGPGLGAWRQAGGGPREPIRAKAPDPGQGFLAVQSRSHQTPLLDAYVAALASAGFVSAGRVTTGSAIKFCLVAEGAAHLYARFNPTHEWDTAAGQAVAEGAGARFTTLSGQPFRYNKPSLLNGGFVVQAPGLNLPTPE
jgi:3'(2'), 5'-bisphosphate nucleotidase